VLDYAVVHELCHLRWREDKAPRERQVALR
jgi:hypothetical protein